MTDQIKSAMRDEVLFAFHRECPHPTVDQIIDWTGRYPEFADDLRAHAAIMLDWTAAEGPDEEEVDAQMMSRAQSRTLNAIYHARTAASAAARPDSAVTFDQLLSTAGLNTPQLSRDLDIGRDILSDLFRGKMQPPIGQRLVIALLSRLQTAREQFDHAVAYALAHPSIGHAKATGQPTIVRRSYEQIVRSSSMSPERKSYWLEED